MHRRSDIQRATFGAHGASVELDERRAQLLKDLQQVSPTMFVLRSVLCTDNILRTLRHKLYSCQPTVEIFERSWRSDAAFEVCVSWPEPQYVS